MPIVILRDRCWQNLYLYGTGDSRSTDILIPTNVANSYPRLLLLNCSGSRYATRKTESFPSIDCSRTTTVRLSVKYAQPTQLATVRYKHFSAIRDC